MSKKKYLHKKYTKVPLYFGDLILIITNSNKKLHKKLPQFKKKERLYGHSLLAGHKNRTGFYIVLNFENGFTKMTHDTIAHEALHITHFICHSVGIEYDVDNDEPMTYLLGWVVEQLYTWIDELGFKVELHG